MATGALPSLRIVFEQTVANNAGNVLLADEVTTAKPATVAEGILEIKVGLEINATPVQALPLPKEVAITFENSGYRVAELNDDLIVFRGEGKAYGSWYGLERPTCAAQAERLYNAVDYGNDLTEISTYRIPKGSTIYEGKVAGGDGYQVYLTDSRGTGVVKIKTEELPQSGF